MVYPAGSAWRRWLITCLTTLILGASTSACSPSSSVARTMAATASGCSRVGVLHRKAPPLSTAPPAGRGKRPGIREADEPHGPPVHEPPKYASAGADLGEQGRGRARASPLFQEIKQIPLAGGTSQVRVGCGTDCRPLYGWRPRRDRGQLDPAVYFGRAERFGSESAFQRCAGDQVVRLPAPPGRWFEHPVAGDVEAGR